LKTASIILSVLLLVPVLRFLVLATQLYMGYKSLTSFGVSLARINRMEMPYVILFIVYSAAFAFSLFLNKKKRYVTNIIVSGFLFAAYFITVLFFGFYWLG